MGIENLEQTAEELKRKFYNNCRKPDGLQGMFMVNRMNYGGHAALAKWAFSHLALRGDEKAIDLGCGGGGNVKRLLGLLPEGKVVGLDYSPVSVKNSKWINRQEIEEGRCRICRASVDDIPVGDGKFDLATAFETIYFWPDIVSSFREVHRILKDDGIFMIANDSDGKNPESIGWKDRIDGMEVYDAEALVSLLKEAGFGKVEVDDREEEDTLVVLAYKGVYESDGEELS